jgi:hypothetical protein
VTNRYLKGDYVGVRVEYAGWCDQLHNNVEDLVDSLPAEWQGWEPTNEQMRMLMVLRDMIHEQRTTAQDRRLTG